jgi:GDP-L-fucose synthase
MNTDKIFVAGHNGMVGASILARLKDEGFKNIITINRADLDLSNQIEVRRFFSKEKFDQIYLAAAKVGGIYANNTYPADFIYENLMVTANVIHEAFMAGTKKLLYLGSSCVYPKNCQQPISEELLLSGSLEPTNEPYAIAKIAGIKLCESYNRQYGLSHSLDYRVVMPTNLYGPGDNFHPTDSHVIPSLIRKFYEASTKKLPHVSIWGSGKARREFLHVTDLADACLFVMNLNKTDYQSVTSDNKVSHINVGFGQDYTILEVVEMLKEIFGFQGKIMFDPSKPDGTLQKLLDSSKINSLGWNPKISFHAGLKSTCEDYILNYKKLRH